MVHSPLVSQDLKDELDVLAIANNKGLTVEDIVESNSRGRR